MCYGFYIIIILNDKKANLIDKKGGLVEKIHIYEDFLFLISIYLCIFCKSFLIHCCGGG